MNVTVFAHRTDYDRPRNLQLVTTALNKRWNTQLHVNECNDIMCRDRWKVYTIKVLICARNIIIVRFCEYG